MVLSEAYTFITHNKKSRLIIGQIFISSSTNNTGLIAHIDCTFTSDVIQLWTPFFNSNTGESIARAILKTDDKSIIIANINNKNIDGAYATFAFRY